MFQGFYPKLYKEHISVLNFYINYFETYIQRDVRQLSQIDNLHLFEKFVRILAARTGQLLNYFSIANDIGVSQPTIKKWISILEASYIIFLLPPYYKNIGKRLIKTPKIYFYDTGLVSSLLGIENYNQLKFHHLRGSIFENLIIAEMIKNRFNNAKLSNLFFFRDRTGNEVDVVMEHALELLPIEIKSSETYSKDFIKGIEVFKKFFPDSIKKAFVIYAGKERAKVGNTAFVLWNDFSSDIPNS